MATTGAVNKLVRASVVRLLGRFNHSIDFPSKNQFVILHGPNGVGKTKLLELIHLTFAGNITAVADMPFRAASFEFDSGVKLEIFRRGQEALPDLDDDQSSGDSILVVYTRPDGEKIEWDPFRQISRSEVSASAVRQIERMMPVRRVGNGRFRDMRVGDIVSTREIYRRYADYITGEIWGPDDIPQEISDFLASVDVHLIKTQRLLNIELSDPKRGARDEARSRPTVLEYSEDFSRRLSEALAFNSQVSQDLDREFPRKLLSEDQMLPEITGEAIRARYAEQSEVRRRLSRIEVLDAGGELPFPDRTLKDWEMRVLWNYLDDTERKLQTFQALLDRATLFMEIVNSRFLYKHLELGRSGFRILTAGGSEVQADDLSSGEQHELVLAYDLLFRVSPQSLVLIDEPEISLHVAWQKEFLNDISRISSVNSVRFIVATHSPQIIHKFWKYTIGLEPGYDNATEWN